jgi:hypothetical protein
MSVSEPADEIFLDEEESTEQLSFAPPAKRKIRTQPRDPVIDLLWHQAKDGDLILQPEFQRYFVWDNAKSSRLIESVLLDVPLPTIYLVEEEDGKESVIDGQQRLTSFFKFLDGELPLSGLRILPELNGKRFADLDAESKRRFKKATLRTITIQNDSNPNLRFEIFERLNTGSVALNDQELRNCIYRGEYNDLIRSLANDPDFRFITGINKPEKRMRDVQLVLRSAGFYHASYLKYAPPMTAFLNNEMERYRNISALDADEYRREFKKSVSLIRSMLGTNAFKRYYMGREGHQNGHWETKKFNASLYDILMWGFTQYRDKSQVFPYLDRLREGLIDLMTTDQEFIDSIELSTSSKNAVHKRFDKWRITMADVVGSPQNELRCFTREVKEGLYERDATFRICGQRINDVDDSAVDHIAQYWTGGKTIPENARLTHRYCNVSRSLHDVGSPNSTPALDHSV